MKTPSTPTALLAALAIFFSLNIRADAQDSRREAADMLAALKIKIDLALRAGDKDRVKELQKRYIDIQRKWDVEPTGTVRPARPAPAPAAPATTWSSTRGGNGKITGYRGGPIRVKKASVYLPNFWADVEDRTPNQSGRGAVLKFTDEGGTVYTYTGNWNFRGNRAVSLRVGDGEGGTYTGTLTMAPGSGISTVSLVGQGDAEGYDVTFAD